MNLEHLQVRLEGSNELILHNGQISINPLHPLTKTIKQFTGKRKKTDQDHGAIAKLEWLTGCYLTSLPEVIANSKKTESGVEFISKEGKDHHFIMPSFALEAMIVNGAKKQKLGTQFKASVFVPKDCRIEFPDMNRDIEWIYESGKYTDQRVVRVQRNAIIRTRPIFTEWALDFGLEYMTDMVDKAQIIETLETCGRIIGLCEHRPRFGRFDLASAA